MEHVNLINRIIEAEQKAQEIAVAAKVKRQSLQLDLESAAGDMRRAYLDRATRRIEDIREKEEALAGERLAAIEEHYTKELSAMENAFSEHRAEWVNKLFSLIVGR